MARQRLLPGCSVEIVTWRYDDTPPKPKRTNIPKLPVICWYEIPKNMRSGPSGLGLQRPDNELCKAALQPTSYGASESNYPRCSNKATATGFCAYHESLISKVGTESFADHQKRMKRRNSPEHGSP